MTVSGSIAFSTQEQAAFGGLNTNNNSSFVATAAWQYQISDTVSVNLRYSYLQRQSGTAAFDMYQNLLILGITKTF
jgi:opacity protein-like surface antigen